MERMDEKKIGVHVVCAEVKGIVGFGSKESLGRTKDCVFWTSETQKKRYAILQINEANIANQGNNEIIF